MNIYFLVEGKAEGKIYPQWLTYLVPELKRVKYHDDVVNPTLVKYTKFYNVKTNDPELMGKYPGFAEHQQFHKAYFKLLYREKHIRYSERHPRDVLEESYLEQLHARINDTNHLATFRHFYEFCQKIKLELTTLS